MPDNPLKKQFTKITQNIYELDFIQLYKNNVRTPFIIRYKSFLQKLGIDLGISSPFEYNIDDNNVDVAIKGGITDLTPDSSMFVFDEVYDLVENPDVIEDKFFIRESGIAGSDISLKPITP